MARQAVNEMLAVGQWVYSPIVHNHHLADLGRDWSFWEEYDLTVLDRCDELHILTLDGWDMSKGVTGEKNFAFNKGTTVIFREPPITPGLYNGMTIARR